MRHFVLMTASVSVLALAGCSSISHMWGSGEKAPAPGSKATAAAPTAIAPSAQEQKEISSVMGGDGVTGVYVEPGNVPPPPSVDGAGDAAATADATPQPKGAPTQCPAVEVLPATKSITYFDGPEGKPSGAMVARASLVDIRGGCDYTDNSVVVDIDMIMQGKITDKGRFDGRRDLEAFMTFPYFVAVMAPDGHMVDKKIMATAMRFKPDVDDLDHAEKITQTIPLPNIAQGGKYTITLGFQLNRQQLEYNRGQIGSEQPAEKPAAVKAPAKKAAVKTEDKKAEAAVTPAPAAAMPAAPAVPATPATAATDAALKDAAAAASTAATTGTTAASDAVKAAAAKVEDAAKAAAAGAAASTAATPTATPVPAKSDAAKKDPAAE